MTVVQSVKYPSSRTHGLKRGGSPGRPKGTPNKATAEAKEAAARIVDDPVYQRNLLTRARAGNLAPAVEMMLWQYARGRPADQVPPKQEVTFRWLDSSEVASGDSSG